MHARYLKAILVVNIPTLVDYYLELFLKDKKQLDHNEIRML